MSNKGEGISGGIVAGHPRQSADGLEHIVPGWFAWVDRYIALTGLLVTEIFVSWLFLVTNGWIANVTHPETWTLIQWIGAGIYLGGACGFAGVVVSGSYRAAKIFGQGHPFQGLLIIVGMLLFTLAEIYAGMSERSNFVDPSPVDRAFGDALGLTDRITLGIIIVSIMVPVAVFYRGWTQVRHEEEDEDSRAKRHVREEADAAHKARMTAIRAGGAGAALRAAKQGLAGAPVAGETSEPTALGDQGTAAQPSRPLREKRVGPSGASGVPAGVWIWGDLQQYVRAKYGIEMTEDEAKNGIRGVPSVARIDGATGKPNGAPKAEVKKWADARYAAKLVAISGASDERSA